MATSNKVFTPVSWVPQKIAVSASSQSVALTGLTKSEDSVELTNNTTEIIYISFTAGSGTAAVATSKGIPAGVVVCYGIAPDVTHINVIGTGATGNFEVLVGKGA